MANTGLVPASKEKEVSNKTGLPVEQVSNGVVMFGGKPYLNSAGRRYKMDSRFGPGEWSIRVSFLEEAELKTLLKMWGRELPCIVAKCQVIYNDKVIAEDYGWCAPDTAPAGASQFKKDGIGLASTKDQNRAMGQMIANGFASEARAGERQRMTIETNSVEAGFLKETARLKKEVGEEEYYRVLSAHGVEHADDASLQGDPAKMGEIITEMAMSAGKIASEAVFGGPVHPNPDPPVTKEERDSGRQELLERIQDVDLPVEARGDAVMDLLVEVCAEQKLMEECPIDQDKSYAEIASEYVSEAMENNDFGKCYDVLKRSMQML